MEDAAGKLAKRLEQKGGSAEDWALLARSYVELKLYPEATRAFAQAIEKAPGDEQLKLEAANARQAAAGAPAAR
jgi:cytochrome c-type biogenesis protein CcmH